MPPLIYHSSFIIYHSVKIASQILRKYRFYTSRLKNLYEEYAPNVQRRIDLLGLASGAKRGPKPKGTGPHNQAIERRIKELEAEDMVHVAGGSKTEEFIRTPGGKKLARRPDITMWRPDGSLYRENVGRTRADGSPFLREVDALDDLERQLGERPGFTPYHSCFIKYQGGV